MKSFKELRESQKEYDLIANYGNRGAEFTGTKEECLDRIEKQYGNKKDRFIEVKGDRIYIKYRRTSKKAIRSYTLKEKS